jgi:transcriptional regulator
MYNPKHFEEARVDELHRFMRDHPLATVVVDDGSGLAADHIPLTADPHEGPHGVLMGHVARANPLCRKASSPIDCLVVFQGVQRYISPSWYASKADDERVVPTWNYEVVHVHGRIHAVDDPEWLARLLHRLTAEHEAGQPSPWRVGDAPADYIDRMMRSIVGLRIEIVSMVGKAKVSQNQPARNRHSLIQALRANGDTSSTEMASAIERRGGGGS